MKPVSRLRPLRAALSLLALSLLMVLALAPRASAGENEASPGTGVPPALIAVRVPATAGPNAPTVPDTTSIVFRVTIERVVATNNFDGPFGFDRADFFGRVRIDTTTQESTVISNDDDITPFWEFAATALFDDTLNDETVTLTVGVWDADDFNNRQEADLTTTSNRSLELNVNVAQCLSGVNAGTVTGSGVNAACGQTITSQGTASENTARIEFRVQADRPPTAPGLNVLCLHEPLWPQPGDNVTVKAEALSDTLGQKLVDGIDVFLASTAAPANTCALDDECSASATAGGDSIFYGCRVRDGDDVVWSGWKRVQVGNPPLGQQAVPVIFTGPSRSRVDIVFVPDVDSFPNPSDSQYLSQVRTAIRMAYFGGNEISPGGLSDTDRAFGERLFLSNQDRINFWLARDGGDIDGTPSKCSGISKPTNWDTDYAFADSGALLHQDEFRDCALPGDRIFGSETFSFRTMIHETLHSPFGLADEYCCDSHYFQPNPLPNLYGSESACLNDILSLSEWDPIIGDPARTGGSCMDIGNGMWTSEATADDIMSNRGEFNAADVRRVQFLFDRCASASCGLLLGRSEATPGGSPEDPVPEFEYETTDKYLAMNTVFESRTEMLVPTVKVNYGYAPMLEAQPPMLQVDMLTSAGLTFRRFNLWNPLLRLGTYDPEVQQPHGPAEWLDETESTMFVPFAPELYAVRITDLELNQVLATVNVRPAIRAFCAEHEEDEDCGVVNNPPGITYIPFTRGK